VGEEKQTWKMARNNMAHEGAVVKGRRFTQLPRFRRAAARQRALGSQAADGGAAISAPVGEALGPSIADSDEGAELVDA
jgi:hypothetical protein